MAIFYIYKFGHTPTSFFKESLNFIGYGHIWWSKRSLCLQKCTHMSPSSWSTVLEQFFFITAAVRHCSYSLACKQPRGCPIVVAEHWQLIPGALGMIPDGCQFVSFLYFLWQWVIFSRHRRANFAARLTGPYRLKDMTLVCTIVLEFDATRTYTCCVH